MQRYMENNMPFLRANVDLSMVSLSGLQSVRHCIGVIKLPSSTGFEFGCLRQTETGPTQRSGLLQTHERTTTMGYACIVV
jgi:hypothetical protein